MCFFSRSGYRPFINPPPSLRNLLLHMFKFILVSFCFLLILGLQLGSVIGLAFRVRDRDR